MRLAALELLERTGRLPLARDFIGSFGSRRGLTLEDRARLSTVDGLIAKHLGHIADAERHFLQACRLAEQADALELLCWAQIRLLGVAVDSSTKDKVPLLRSELLRNVERTGSAVVTVAFHIFTAEHEAKHGQLSLSKLHGEMAESLLVRHGNAWLSGLLDLQKSCLNYLEGDFSMALKFARSAWKGSAESGHLQTRLLALADMAAAYLAVGQPARANRCTRHALRAANPDEQIFGLLLETLAEGQLENRDLAGCAESLARAESIATILNQHRSAWCKDWNLRTKARLFQRRGQWKDCLNLLRGTAKPNHASFSASQIQVLESLSLSKTGDASSAAHVLSQVFSRPIDASPILQGLVQTAVAGLLASEGLLGSALSQYSRALRIISSTGESSELVESVDQYVELVNQEHETPFNLMAAEREVTIWRPAHISCHLDRSTQLATRPEDTLFELLAFVGSVVDLASDPRAIGEEALRTLAALAWIENGVVEKASADGTREVVASHTGLSQFVFGASRDTDPRESVIPLGTKAGSDFYLRIVPRQHPNAALGCAATARLILALVKPSDRLETPAPPNTAQVDTEVDVVGGKTSIFRSSVMSSLVAEVRRVAPQNITVLLTGETGTGKEVIANLIHEAAGINGRPFVVFNCATVPIDMVESQLFGYRRGAFTGAIDSFIGMIRAAESGTLFLDEIAELPIATQPKLLRFLDALEIQPLGEALPHRVNVRVVAATNADLEQRVKEGRFRDDLFYRLNVVHFHLPPLRERREDIRPLAEVFLNRAMEEAGKIEVNLSDDVVEHFKLRPWPGNVRQLFHEIRRIAAFTDSGTTVRLADLDRRLRTPASQHGNGTDPADNTINIRIDRPLNDAVMELEGAVLRHALVASDFRNDEAAQKLGLSRKGLYLKRRRLGIGEPDRSGREKR